MRTIAALRWFPIVLVATTALAAYSVAWFTYRLVMFPPEDEETKTKD